MIATPSVWLICGVRTTVSFGGNLQGDVYGGFGQDLLRNILEL